MIVKSKYKNPDRFIEKLKEEVRVLKNVRSSLIAEKGTYVFSYGDDVELSVKPSTKRIIRSFRVFDKVIFHGRVIEITEEAVRFGMDTCFNTNKT